MKGIAEKDKPFELKGVFGGMELGFWKFLGTTTHFYGLSLTAANHGAFLIQLTTLFVPIIQGLQGEKIPCQIQLAIVMALGGVYLFTQDPNSIARGEAAQQAAIGDGLCVAAALFILCMTLKHSNGAKRSHVPSSSLPKLARRPYYL